MEQKERLLWYRRAVILNALARRLNCCVNPPDELVSLAREKREKNADISLLLRALDKVLADLFSFWKGKYASVFAHFAEKEAVMSSAHAASSLEEKLYMALLKCRVGQEKTFPAYFGYYIKGAYSELVSESVTPFTVSDRERRLVRKILSLHDRLKEKGESEKNAARLISSSYHIPQEFVRQVICNFPTRQKFFAGINNGCGDDPLPELTGDIFSLSFREARQNQGNKKKKCRSEIKQEPLPAGLWRRLVDGVVQSTEQSSP